jgi:hypothetical protein
VKYSKNQETIIISTKYCSSSAVTTPTVDTFKWWHQKNLIYRKDSEKKRLIVYTCTEEDIVGESF